MHDHSQHHKHPGSTQSNLKTAFFLNLTFTILEIFGGIWTNSMAIVSDAFHDFADSLVLGFSWHLEKYAQKGSDQRYSYGYKRFSLLSALVSGMVLITGSIIILYKVIPRIFHPEPTNAQGMMIFAIAGVLINGLAVLRLRNGKTLNARVVSWHLLEDVFGWIAILIVSIILRFTDLYILDPILSCLFTIYVLFHVIGIFRKTLGACLMAIPENIDPKLLEAKILKLDKVISTHHTHIWSLDGEQHVISTHIVVDSASTKDELIRIKQSVYGMVKELDCEHITIEFEYADERCGLSH